MIDDVPENRDVVVALLSMYKLTYIASCDDRQARATVKNFHPDVVVVDLAMPTEDGTQIAAWIRKEYPQIRIVMYSAFPLERLKIAVNEVKADAFLRKPFDADDLYKAVVGA